jgi:putative hydrolases of HD superfamily
MKEVEVKAKVNDIEKIFDFLHKVNNLKKTIRYGKYDIDGDSSADHSWRLALMTFIIADEFKLEIDILKAMKIALTHDLPEAITGDIPYMEINNGNTTKEDKNKKEIDAIKEITSTLPDKFGKEIYQLWEDYEYSKSKEGLFVKALDKIETMSYVIEKGRKYTDLDLIATYPDKHINNFPELIPILKELKSRMKKEFIKRGIKWKEEYDKF